MPKTYGAMIICCECNAQPFAPAGIRETFDLTKADDGQWRCELHRPSAPEKRAPASPTEALDTFEATLKDAGARFCEAVADVDDPAPARAVEDFQEKTERALVLLKSTLAPRKPPAEARSKPRRRISATERSEGQVELLGSDDHEFNGAS
jgi:hypothetical protein